jgi:hypothetical protein
MKRIFFSATLLLTIGLATKAQNFLTKVPNNSSVVIKYAAENFAKNLPLKKIDSYNFIKDNFFKLLNIDTLTSLQNLCINFEQDTYQYVNMQDTCLNFVTLLHLNNAEQFLQLIKGAYKAGSATKTEKKNGFDIIAIANDTYVGWNQTQAIIVHSSYQNKKNYYDYLYSTDATAADSTAVAIADAMVATDTAISFTPPKIVKDKKPLPKKGTVKKTPPTKGKTATKKPVVKKKPIRKDAIEK